ncbi:MAG TPA: hypothetical protein VJZ25_07070 [Gemmatimonadaceae bacterium]|nr:hypothetical protein [Gemmatimonadaceae bacterium]
MFARETLSPELIEELTPLLQQHCTEVEDESPLDVDWERYYAAASTLRLYTVRLEDLIGYASFFVVRNPHFRYSLQALQDTLFLNPFYRGRFIGPRFIEWCDRQLALEGVQKVYHHVKTAHDFGPMLEMLGYSCVELVYARRLDHGGVRGDGGDVSELAGHAESGNAGGEGHQAAPSRQAAHAGARSDRAAAASRGGGRWATEH